MNRVFVDTDGVIEDFDVYKTAPGLTGGGFGSWPTVEHAKRACEKKFSRRMHDCILLGVLH